jgi:hypothetical protein
MLSSGCAIQEGPLVITAKEAAAAQARDPEDELILRQAAERGAPAIVVDRPESLDVTMPVTVRVRFVPQENAEIVLKTLKVKVGLLNLTRRVRKRMRVTPEGIEGDIDASIHGTYTVKVSVADDQKRTGRSAFTINVID